MSELRDEDDTGGEPVFIVSPADNVYSYFLFIGPTESKKNQQGINWDIVMAYFLVVMNFFMQGLILFLIFGEVVVSNVEWQNGILKLGKDPVMGLLTEPPQGCNDNAALCVVDSRGQYTCSPPSVQLTGRWEELDTDNDGIWTRKEVEEAKDRLKCKYAVNPVEVFDVFIGLLKNRRNIIWIHPDIEEATAIHLPYFTYAMADLVMCTYRSKDMCPNLIQRGFFDAPMKYGTAPRVGTSVNSALKYCNALLEPGGTCEQLLPSTYGVWKIQSQIECGEPSYEMFKFTNPGNGVTKSLLEVDYSARAEYEMVQGEWFMVFKGIMLFVWLLFIVCEVRRIVIIVTLLLRMPDAAEYGDDAVLVERDPSDPEDIRYRIQGITSSHRTQMFVLTILRAVMTCVLAVVGLSYLIKTNGYSDLVMNGVTLAFIAEISSLLYDQILREEVKDQTGDIKNIKVRQYGIDWLNRRPALVDIIYVFGIAIAVCVIMQWQFNSIVVPVHNSLSCTCVVEGDNCVEAQRYNNEFWNNYWKSAVPDVFKELEQLKAATLGQPAAPASFISTARAVDTSESLEQRMEELESTNEALMGSLQDLEQEVPPTLEDGTPADVVAVQTKHEVTGRGPSHGRAPRDATSAALVPDGVAGLATTEAGSTRRASAREATASVTAASRAAPHHPLPARA